MKKIYFFIALLTISISSQAQQYFPMLDSVNVWSYATQMIGVRIAQQAQNAGCTYPLPITSGNFQETTLYDTTINSIVYKKVDNSMFGCYLGFVREDTAARKILFLDNVSTVEKTLYDFSMQPGDTMSLNFDSFGGYVSGIYTLDSIRTITIHAGQRRAFYLNCHTSAGSPTMTWIESVGCPTEIFYPYFSNYMSPSIFSSCAGIQHQFSQFVCCFNHASRVYDDPCAYQVALSTGNQGSTVIDSCDYYNFMGAVHEINSFASISVSPNPAKNKTKLHLSLTEETNVTVVIWDIAGRETIKTIDLGKTPSGESDHELDLSELANGIYTIEVRSVQGSVFDEVIIAH
ncbi:MAG TPA: T9SS type A sorting domain-containing protein [Bacteroidia bacterium]|jgi:hypothetical protein|nr:T9SS type A sorting domain-containing protein [Bacteroidia bacterium]